MAESLMVAVSPAPTFNAMEVVADFSFEDLATYRRLQARNRRLPEADRAAANAALAKARNAWVADYSQRWMSDALSVEKPLARALEWFWFNHFNVFWRKGVVGPALPDFVEGAIRPHVNGRFRDLLLAVTTHPAMLVYLDNSSNVAGRLNENLARELLELHTLGVDGGYAQADVRAVAHLLSGFGLRPLGEIRWPERLRDKVVERGEFLFDPRRHDFAEKVVLGKTFAGEGYAEVEGLVDHLTSQPATARHIARKLCVFLWGDAPPEAMMKAVAEAFQASDGHLQQTADVALAFIQEAGKVGEASFKMPMAWVFSALGWLLQGRRLRNVRPVRRWLEQLGQPLFGRSTPDGYSLKGADWLSSGQLAQRFFIAREMVERLPALMGMQQAERAMNDVRVQAAMGALSVNSQMAIEQAGSTEERVALLLSSPEFMHRRPGEVWG